jgi:hypothetical protein
MCVSQCVCMSPILYARCVYSHVCVRKPCAGLGIFAPRTQLDSTAAVILSPRPQAVRAMIWKVGLILSINCVCSLNVGPRTRPVCTYKPSNLDLSVCPGYDYLCNLNKQMCVPPSSNVSSAHTPRRRRAPAHTCLGTHSSKPRTPPHVHECRENEQLCALDS